MNIINFSSSISKLDPKEQSKRIYALTHPGVSNKIIDLAGQVLEIAEWVIAEDADVKTGELRTVYYIRSTDGEIYGSVSQTFGRQFNDMISILGEVDAIKIVTGKSKNGREFVTCELA